MTDTTPDDVPVAFAASPPPRRRADATRNREKVLAAAAELFAERGVDAVTMDEVAQRAGVGKGTLYRGFGDKGGLAYALLDERERELQERILSGPAPIGRGAPPAERLAAFISAYARFAAAHIDLLLTSETNAPLARHRTGASSAWVLHCQQLLTEAGAPDPRMRAEALMAMLSAEQVAAWLRLENRSPDEIVEVVSAIATTLCQRGTPP